MGGMLSKVASFLWGHKKEAAAIVMYVGEKLITDQIQKKQIEMTVKDELAEMKKENNI